MSKHIRTFGSFQGKRRNIEIKTEKDEAVNETVIQRDNTYIVGGVKVEQKTINAYAKKVKDQTGKDMKSLLGDLQMAEDLVNWAISNLDNVDNIPVSAILGGDEEAAQDLDDMDVDVDLDETGELDMSDDSGDDLDMSDDSGDDLDMSDDSDTAGEDDLDMSDDSGDEDFESPTGEDEDEDDDLDMSDDSGEEEEEDELPI